MRFLIQTDKCVNTIRTDFPWCIVFIIYIQRFNSCLMTIYCLADSRQNLINWKMLTIKIAFSSETMQHYWQQVKNNKILHYAWNKASSTWGFIIFSVFLLIQANELLEMYAKFSVFSCCKNYLNSFKACCFVLSFFPFFSSFCLLCILHYVPQRSICHLSPDSGLLIIFWTAEKLNDASLNGIGITLICFIHEKHEMWLLIKHIVFLTLKWKLYFDQLLYKILFCPFSLCKSP